MTKKIFLMLFSVFALVGIVLIPIVQAKAIESENEPQLFGWINKSTDLVLIGQVAKIEPITLIETNSGFANKVNRGLATLRVDEAIIGNISGTIEFLIVNHIYYDESGNPLYQLSSDEPWIKPKDNILIVLKPVEITEEQADKSRKKRMAYHSGKFVRFLEQAFNKEVDQDLFIGDEKAKVGKGIPNLNNQGIDPYSYVTPIREIDTQLTLLGTIDCILDQAN